jgi:hypothetical protein
MRPTGESDLVPAERRRAALAIGHALRAEAAARARLLAEADRHAAADGPAPVSLVRAAERLQVACHELRAAHTRLEVAPPSVPPPA